MRAAGARQGAHCSPSEAASGRRERGGRMKRRALAIGSAATVVLALVAYAAFEAGLERGRTRSRAPAASTNATHAAPAARRAHPRSKRATSIRRPARKCSTGTTRWCPGRSSTSPANRPSWTCSSCRSTPRAAATKASVAISPRMQQNLGVRTAEVTRGDARFGASRRSATSLTTSATSLSCRRAATASSRGSTCARRWIRVRKGQPLAELYVPEWVAAQEEYLSAKRLSSASTRIALDGLVDAARAAHAARRHERRADRAVDAERQRCSRD